MIPFFPKIGIAFIWKESELELDHIEKSAPLRGEMVQSYFLNLKKCPSSKSGAKLRTGIHNATPETPPGNTEKSECYKIYYH